MVPKVKLIYLLQLNVGMESKFYRCRISNQYINKFRIVTYQRWLKLDRGST